jgi:hypothetical protein
MALGGRRSPRSLGHGDDRPDVLEHEQPKYDLGGRARATSPRALWTAPTQRLDHYVHQRWIVEHLADPAHPRIHELLGRR